MVAWKEGATLRIDQAARPILWERRLDVDLPSVSDEDLAAIMGDGGSRSRRIVTFGHTVPNDRAAPHFLLTRAGTPLHTDPAYVRFTHHVVLRNEGMGIRGLSGAFTEEPLSRGAFYCLDSWSPHEVAPDERLPQVGLYKCQMAVDSPEPLTPEEALLRMTPMFDRPFAR